MTEHSSSDQKLEEAEELLEEARQVLDHYWFSPDGSYNNEDVIAISERIDAYFRGDDPLEVVGS